MPTTTSRTITDRAGAICRQIFSLGHSQAEWEPDDLQWLLTMQKHLDHCCDQAVRACRDNGHTDAEIADAFGITRQAVSKRWPGGGRYVGAAGRYRQSRGGDRDGA